jgi:hypothetical protein
MNDDPVPPAAEGSALVRYGFVAIFIAASLYRLEIGIRVAGVFLLGISLYEIVLGRVPLIGIFSWKPRGYVKGPVAAALIVGMIFVSGFFIFAPDLVLKFVATTRP